MCGLVYFCLNHHNHGTGKNKKSTEPESCALPSVPDLLQSRIHQFLLRLRRKGETQFP